MVSKRQDQEVKSASYYLAELNNRRGYANTALLVGLLVVVFLGERLGGMSRDGMGITVAALLSAYVIKEVIVLSVNAIVKTINEKPSR